MGIFDAAALGVLNTAVLYCGADLVHDTVVDTDVVLGDASDDVFDPEDLEVLEVVDGEFLIVEA